jgi:CRISPR-associated protein Cst1
MEIDYTGHPFYDVGLATLCAFKNRAHPSDLRDSDLSEIADYIAREYVVNPLKSFLTVAFTSNAWFAQSGYDPSKAKVKKKKAERVAKRKRFASAHLRAWETEVPTEEKCVFTGLPIAGSAPSSSLREGRAGRAQVPLLLGDVDINFYAGGNTGLPISGIALIAIHAMPLGCVKTGGKLLAVHSTNSEITQYFAKSFLADNRRLVELAQQSDSSKLPESKRSGKTLLIEKLLQAETEMHYSVHPACVTAYHFTNGQQPTISVYNLPTEITAFLAATQTAAYKAQWDRITARSWALIQTDKGKGKKKQRDEPSKNYLYEDFYSLPLSATMFVRTYFLRLPRQRTAKDDPSRSYSLRNEYDLVSWSLVQLFLERVLQMTEERIERIRKLGDRLADYVRSRNDKTFFRSFFIEQRYDYFRTVLLKALNENLKSGKEPLLTLDEYLAVFEEGEEVAYSNWRLARDLVLIKMIEKLHGDGWLKSNIEALPEMEENTELQLSQHN